MQEYRDMQSRKAQEDKAFFIAMNKDVELKEKADKEEFLRKQKKYANDLMVEMEQKKQLKVIEMNEQKKGLEVEMEDIEKLQEELKELRNIIKQPRLHYKLMETLGYEQLLNAYEEREKLSSEKKKPTHTKGVNINFGE